MDPNGGMELADMPQQQNSQLCTTDNSINPESPDERDGPPRGPEQDHLISESQSSDVEENHPIDQPRVPYNTYLSTDEEFEHYSCSPPRLFIPTITILQIIFFLLS